MPTKWRPELLGDGAGGARAEEGIENDVPGPGGREQDAGEQRLGLLGGMGLAALVVLQAFIAGAQRDQPVGAHLHVFVASLQSLVIEGITGALVARGPDQGLVGIGEALAAEVRHRIGLAPDDIVEDPEVEILQAGADAEDVVVGADHPERRIGLHHALDGGEPGIGEVVVMTQRGEFIPIVVDGVDH